MSKKLIEEARSRDDKYFLGYRRAEQERLQVQARQLAHESEWLFDQLAIGTGDRVVDIGGGPQGCLDLLALMRKLDGEPEPAGALDDQIGAFGADDDEYDPLEFAEMEDEDDF